MKFSDAIERARNLQEFEVQVTVPADFRFRGQVPFDMEILGDQAFVQVYALTLQEAVDRAQAFFNAGADDE